MKRIQKQLGMLFVFLCTVILTGCNDEESNPLRFDQSVMYVSLGVRRTEAQEPLPSWAAMATTPHNATMPPC